MVNSNRGYGDDYQASFAGYFPADDPQYSCIVVIAGPTKQIYGAEVSGTVFAAIANKVYSSSLGYHKSINLEEPTVADLPQVKYGNVAALTTALAKTRTSYNNNTNGSEYVVGISSENKVDLQPRIIAESGVPNVKGMAVNDAVYILENKGLIVRLEGSGAVSQQIPAAGQPIQEGSIIKLILN